MGIAPGIFQFAFWLTIFGLLRHISYIKFLKLAIYILHEFAFIIVPNIVLIYCLILTVLIRIWIFSLISFSEQFVTMGAVVVSDPFLMHCVVTNSFCVAAPVIFIGMGAFCIFVAKLCLGFDRAGNWMFFFFIIAILLCLGYLIYRIIFCFQFSIGSSWRFGLFLLSCS